MLSLNNSLRRLRRQPYQILTFVCERGVRPLRSSRVALQPLGELIWWLGPPRACSLGVRELGANRTPHGG